MTALKYRTPSVTKSIWVLLTSIGLYVALLSVAYYLSKFSYLWVLALALPTHFAHARMFVVMHDCGHRSFFKNRLLNDIFGHICGFFYYTPFYMWRELHNKHHAFQGNLDKRGNSLDVWTLTTKEFKSKNFITQAAYRFYRNPFVILVISPLVLFLIIFRLPFEKFSTKAVINIILLDVLLIYLVLEQSLFTKFFLIQAPSLMLSFCIASFLFYSQHQFENTLWLKDSDYSNEKISLYGSSFFCMSPFYNLAYGNIGFHHIHHLDAKIPMYRLSEAQQELRYNFTAITIKSALQSLRLSLWDEEKKQLVSF